MKKKSRKKPITPNSTIIHALRRLWLQSRERAAALKRDGYICQDCGGKQSKAKGKEFKVEVHHVRGIDWSGLAELIRGRLLTGELVTLCPDCHDKRHDPTVKTGQKQPETGQGAV